MVFEDGMGSAFSKQLVTAIETHADTAMVQIIRLYKAEQITPTVLAETLRWLGQMGFGTSYSRRRWLLEQALRHPSPIVRDGAIVGLSLLEDPQQSPRLRLLCNRSQARYSNKTCNRP